MRAPSGGCDVRWAVPPPDVVLPPDDVHVWQAALDVPDTQRTQLRETLTPDERQRAERLVVEQHRQHWIVARGLLRRLLGQYTVTPPSQIRFDYGERGKPFLALPQTSGIEFNLAHSHGLALFAFARKRQLGIDLERQTNTIHWAQIAERFFHPQEYAILRRLSQAEQHAAFFMLWTLKESYIKARGDGLWRSLNTFEIVLNPSDGTATPGTGSDDADTHRWSLRVLQPAADYAAALAVEGSGWHLRLWQWLPGA